MRRILSNDRRLSVSRSVGRAIAAAPDTDAEARDRLTADLWDRLTENDRIDADLADTALPLETLVLRLCRDLGIPPDWAALAAGPAGEDEEDEDPGSGPESGPPPAADPPPRDPSRPSCVVARGIWASDVGGPEGERWIHDVTTGEVTDKTGKVVRTLPVPDQPWRIGCSELDPPVWPPPAESAAPPEPEPPETAPPETDAERRRREYEAQCRLYGLTPHPP
ncbi:hypothetical protein [Inquilinus sp. CA228]|uniref:hypothetical protein n=1 Tax=Inquilinus sp. CA228 TaxID=3455609 RepID=UPI003F8D09D5